MRTDSHGHFPRAGKGWKELDRAPLACAASVARSVPTKTDAARGDAPDADLRHTPPLGATLDGRQQVLNCHIEFRCSWGRGRGHAGGGGH